MFSVMSVCLFTSVGKRVVGIQRKCVLVLIVFAYLTPFGISILSNRRNNTILSFRNMKNGSPCDGGVFPCAIEACWVDL